MANEFVTITEAGRRLGVSSEFMRRRLRDGELVAFTNPKDGRSKLIPVELIERFATPRPLTTARMAGEGPSDAA